MDNQKKHTVERVLINIDTNVPIDQEFPKYRCKNGHINNAIGIRVITKEQRID